MKSVEFTNKPKEVSSVNEPSETKLAAITPRNPMTKTECECIGCDYSSTCNGVCGDFHSNR